MEQVTIIEMVMWKSVDGINPKEAKESITKLNDFVSEQPGFISRKTALAEDGRFLDIVYWTDLKSAKNASEKAMKAKELIPIFSTIDQKEFIFQHFEIFNKLEK
ncbi:hypothetical protein [Maribacter sp. 2210JD10-5]|uniref:hypothetical protein n=1 Tax=Maribacter sp. 2210JD10-5 TaxID=3386272 RepID=UPI0039BD6EC1